jgi:hypothetical protein
VSRRVPCFDRLNRAHAIPTGHLQVHQRDIGGKFVVQFEGHFAICSHSYNFKSGLTGQHPCQTFPDNRMIVCDQNTNLFHGSS